MEDILISVVVKVYNHEHFLLDSLPSVINQSYNNLEIIVCDDGSTDKSQEIIKTYAEKDNRIIALMAPKNEGLCANFNKGLDRCTGKYIAILDGDDIMLPERIEKQAKVLESDPKIGICSHDMEVFDSDTGEKLYNFSEKYRHYSNPKDSIFFTNWFFKKKLFRSCPSAMMVRSDHYRLFRYDARCPVLSEFLHGIDMYAHNPKKKWHTIPEVLGKWRKHLNNMSNSNLNAETHSIKALEETFIVFGIAAARYPQYAKEIKNTLLFRYYSNLIFGWLPVKYQKQHEKQFRTMGGNMMFIFLKISQFYLKLRRNRTNIR
ncbi:MAG: glycosyltransferase family 2 protein [Bacteroidia bacterium]|nr:glycosyltransferase family 2 protein [Bacteroidia bacterium]